MPDWDKGLGLGDGDDVDGEAGQPGKGKDKKEAGSDASSRSGKAVGTVVNTTNTTADAAADTPPTTASSWWFASTAIPLLAATTGPLSNVLSIAALVTPWRVALPDNGQLPLGADNNGVGIADPHWCVLPVKKLRRFFCIRRPLTSQGDHPQRAVAGLRLYGQLLPAAQLHRPRTLHCGPAAVHHLLGAGVDDCRSKTRHS